MNIKQHNDIVQKLLQQIQIKDKQLTKLNKQLTALSKSSSQAQFKASKPTPPADIQKQVQKRISQLTKQHNAKLAQLNQEIKSLNQQNNDLKQRLALKNNLQQKQRQHIAEVIKKNIDRKPGSQHDLKVTALVGHYEAELGKKNTYIEMLKRQVKALSMGEGKLTEGKYNSRKTEIETKASLGNLVQQNQEENDEREFEEQKHRKWVPLLEHNQAVQKLQTQIKRLDEKQKAKTKQLTDLRAKYNQLTKQYYRVLNEYGIQTATLTKAPNTKLSKPITNKTNFKKDLNSAKFNNNKNHKESRISFNLSDEQQDEEPRSTSILPSLSYPNEVSISVDFEEKFKKFNNRPRINPNQQEDDLLILEQQNLSLAPSSKETTKVFAKKQSIDSKLLQQILSILNISDPQQILPTLTSLTTQLSFAPTTEQIIKSLHQLLYKFGLGKVARSQMLDSLKVFEAKCSSWVQSHQLINQICIELGAKRPKLLEKIAHYKNSQTQYLQKMKSINFLTQLNKSHKLLEFINFFQLDKSQLLLPEQLKNIYQQLRFVDKFVKQAHMTMELTDKKGLEEVLEIVLRKLEKYHEWEIELQKENQRKILNKQTQRAASSVTDKY